MNPIPDHASGWRGLSRPPPPSLPPLGQNVIQRGGYRDHDSDARDRDSDARDRDSDKARPRWAARLFVCLFGCVCVRARAT